MTEDPVAAAKRYKRAKKRFLRTDAALDPEMSLARHGLAEATL